MKVAKWGNSLAVRLPAVVVEALELKEGDDIQIDVRDVDRVESRTYAVSPRIGRTLAVGLVELLPADFKFDRLEANERG